jgi:hypothetical protein
VHTRDVLKGVRRFLVVAAAAVAVTLAGSLLVGLLTHEPARRAVSVGMYAIGSLSVVLGLFHGIQPPVRAEGDGAGGGPFGPFARGSIARWATPAEHRDSEAASGLFVVLGLALLVVGLAIDGSHRIV